MYQTGGNIKDVLDKIATNKYVLPAIQREFVWNQEQICQLFDSVMQGYPFGEFLFWEIEPKKSGQFRYYGFVRDYHQRDNPHCPDLGNLPNQQMVAVLDGQQRLTAFNIGLRGSMAVKLPRKHWNSADAFPRRFLALDLLATNERDEEGSCYVFNFKNEESVGSDGDHLWFKVPDILDMKSGPDMNDWILAHDLDREKTSRAFRTLDKLHHVVHAKPTVAYYEEKNQDIEHVLNIFIRRNSGGTVLSYSDLLLSIAVSQWDKLDARKEVHQLVDDLRDVAPNLDFSKDFVLKAGLMLTDISSVGFQVKNFTRNNMAVLEENWREIRNALILTARLASSFGFDSRSIRANSALHPIAYYLYRIDSPSGFVTKNKFKNVRKAIRDWLVLSILKSSGIWGSGLDTLLTALREALRNATDEQFPASEMMRVMAKRGKSLEFSPEEIEEIADMSINDRRIFSLLVLLFPFLDVRTNNFHIDHVFPKNRFTPTKLKESGVDAGDQLDLFIDSANRVANLQLLEGSANLEKQDKLPVKWMKKHFPDKESCQVYRHNHLLGEVPEDIRDFMGFYGARRKRIRERVASLVSAV